MTKSFAENSFFLSKRSRAFLPIMPAFFIFLFVVGPNTHTNTSHSPVVAFLFPTCQDTFLAASLMAGTSEGEEPLTSVQIWLVAKIRPTQRTQILFTIILAGQEPAGLHLCVSASTRRRHTRNSSGTSFCLLPTKKANQGHMVSKKLTRCFVEN